MTDSEKAKIIDFREAYRRIMNPNNDEEINKIINALFYNVACNYEEYHSDVPYVSMSKESYKFHILKPINGQYSLLDFLLNRAISNVDGIKVEPGGNAYSSRKVLFIDDKRYESVRSKYDEDFIKRQYGKSKLHETGHALQTWDTINDVSIHSRNSIIGGYSCFHGFFEKIKGFESILGHKYANMLHLSEIINASQTIQSKINKGYPFNNGWVSEGATEYFAVKYAKLYEDVKNFKWTVISCKPHEKIFGIFTPNPENGYAHSTKFIYHLENLVSKSAMFDSRFFESEEVFREFAKKYENQIEKGYGQVSKQYPQYFPDNGNAYSKFKAIFKNAFNHEAIYGENDLRREETLAAHQCLDIIFLYAYEQEYSRGKIHRDRMLEILKMSYIFAPLKYEYANNEFIATPIKECYKEFYESLQDIQSDRRGVQSGFER